jgi:alanine-synthesizing transaminase
MSTDTFAARLKQAMSDAGLKQVDLLHIAAERNVKLGKSKLSQYVGGKSTPRADMMSFLASALDVDERWLAKGTAPSADTAAHGTARAAASGTPAGAAGGSGRPSAPTAEPKADMADGKGAGTASASSPIRTTPTANPQKKGTPMRTFNKSSKLDNVLYDVRGPVVDEANRMEEHGVQVLKLNIGNPAPFGFRTPDEVVEDMARQLSDCEGYSASKGLFSARKAIMQYAQIKHLPNVDMNGIYTGNGVSELINLCMQALLDNGDEILIPSPDYPLWTACATLAGGHVVHYMCDEQAEWYPDIEDIRSKVTPRTKAIVIINPNNPTGALYPKEVLEEIVEVARENQLIIFSDEIYDRLVMDGLEHTSIASLAPDLFCITFSGLSKSHMIAGYRVGWMVLSGNKAIAKDYIEGLDMLSNMRLCSNVPAQSIIQTALGGHQSVKDYLVPGGRIFDQREYIYEALNSIPGVSAVKPKAAFYIFPKIDAAKFNITNDEQFALDLLREKKLLIVQGSGFNWHEPNHFRVVYLPRVAELQDAMGRLESFLSTYHQMA